MDMVVDMRKILNLLKICLLQKDPYPCGIYETSLMNVPPEILRELEDMVDSRRKDLLAAQKGVYYEQR